MLTASLRHQDAPGRRPRSRLLQLAGTPLLLALPACASGPAHQPAAVTPAITGSASAAADDSATNWLQYHGNGARTGAVAGLPAAGRLWVAWSRTLGGAVYGQPLVIGRTVVAATEQDEVYGLNRSTGTVLWKTKVGSPLPISRQPCGNVTPLGITSTPVYDPRTRLVYVVAQSGAAGHVLAALRLSDGHVAFSRNVPSPDHHSAFDQQRGALGLADGHIYVVFGGHAGDCGPYIGSIVAMPASRTGPIWSYRVPTRKQGGIWASAGPVVGPDGTVYVSVGNGAIISRAFDDSNSVTALTSGLHRIGVFAPTDWRTLSGADQDLGSMSPALLRDGQILQVGKGGVGYLLNAAHLGGVGGQLAQGRVCAAFGGAAVSGTTVYVPCQGTGLTAVSTAGRAVRVLWRAPGGVDGSPVIGGSAVWAASSSTGILYELEPKTGRIRQQIRLPVGGGAGQRLPHFVSPALSGRLVLVGTMTGVVAVSGA